MTLIFGSGFPFSNELCMQRVYHTSTPRSSPTFVFHVLNVIYYREVLLPWATARPDRFTIRRSKVGRGPQDFVEEVREFPIQGMGLHWEADAVARDLRGQS